MRLRQDLLEKGEDSDVVDFEEAPTDSSHWQHTKRELANLMNVLIPWEIRIKEIESHFGSVVASYFTFLRWLFWVNLVTAVVLIVFVAVPEMLMANTKKAGMRKNMLDDEKANATNLFTLWDFDGVLKYSPLFYGYYSHQDPEDKSLAKSIGYKMPLAYFITELVVYVYSFVAILRRMAKNSRQSKLSEKDDECVFTWKLFTGWDYMIGNSETAHNRTASIILGFKEALLEEAEKKRDEGRNWKVTSLRIFAHLNVVWLLGSSVYAVILVVERSTQPEAEHSWWRKNEITIVITLITSLFPVFFEALGIVEQYHPRKKLRMQLARIMALNLLNLYTLIFASFSKINEMSNTLQSLRPNNSAPLISPLPTAAHQIGQVFTESDLTIPSQRWTPQFTHDTTVLVCRNISVPCPSSQTLGVATMILSLVSNTTPVLFVPFSEISSMELSTSTMSALTPETVNFNGDNTSSSTLNSFVTFGEDHQNYEDYDVVDDESYKRLIEGADNSSTKSYEATTMMNDSVTENSTLFEESFSNNTDGYNESSKFNFTGNETTQDNLSTVSAAKSITLSSPRAPTTESSSEEVCEETVCDSLPASVQTETATKHPTGVNVASTLKPPFLTEAETPQYTDLTSYIDTLDQETLRKLRPLCWETMFGREMVKLTVMDLVMTVLSTLMVDFFRAVFVRYMNNCWCWDLEKKFPQYGDFKMAENILHLVNNQGMVWMGMFFSPGLPLINIIKLAIMMYLRSWAVLTCNVPHEVVFRASSSNNFYLALLLTMLFLCVLPVGYAVVWVVPSWHCGPFSNYYRIYYIFTQSLKKALPYKSLHKAFDYIASPGIVIPLLILLVLIIYYLISLTTSLREANNDLKIQLRRERTEERRKMFQLVDKKRQEAENPIFKWKKAMPSFSRGKMSIADIPIDLLKSSSLINGTAKYDSKHKDLINELVKKTKKMPSGTSEEENGLLDGGEGTDVEQHDSLPFDSSRNLQDVDLHEKRGKIVKKIPKEKKKNRKDNKKRTNEVRSKDIREREDSGWSDIPEIRIIQTESAERLDDVEKEEYENMPLDDNDVKSLDVTMKTHLKDHTLKSSKEKNIKPSTKHDESASLSKVTGEEYYGKYFKNESKKNLESSLPQETLEKTNETVQITCKGDKLVDQMITNDKLADKEAKLKSKIKSGMLKSKDLKVLESIKKTEGELESKHFEASKSNTKSIIPVENKVNSKKSKGLAHSKRRNLETNAEEQSTEDEEGENSDKKKIAHEQTVLKTLYKNKEKTVDKNNDDYLKHSGNESESEDSDVTSQNTVKKVDIEEEKNKNEIPDKSPSSEQTTSADKSAKSTARLRIASVLLKEAKRRSSTGLDEK